MLVVVAQSLYTRHNVDDASCIGAVVGLVMFILVLVAINDVSHIRRLLLKMNEQLELMRLQQRSDAGKMNELRDALVDGNDERQELAKAIQWMIDNWDG